MSRKHKHRADNRPASRRYVQHVVQAAKAEIIVAMFHATPHEPRMTETVKPLDWTWTPYVAVEAPWPSAARIEREVNG